MVLEPDEGRDAELGHGVGEHVADGAALEPAGPDVEQPETGGLHPADPEERLAEELVARADPEDRRTAARCHDEAAVLAQLVRRGGLLRVLAAAEQVDVAGPRQPLPRVHGDDLGGDAARRRALVQDQRVARVAVRAQQVRVDMDDEQHRVPATRGGSAGPPEGVVARRFR